MEVLDQEAAVSENILDVQSKWQPSWEHIARYFLEYKSTILTVSILTPFLLFSLFQNRLYKSQVGFKIEPGQDLTSNILSDSLLGIRPNKNSLDNIPERALITARSTSFYQELSDIVIEHRDHKHIKFKLGEERKGWVEFLKKKLLGKIEVDGKERLHSRISEQLEQVVKVKKEYISNSIGNGPVNALDNALRSVLIKSYPILKKMNLVDYKVRILTPDEGTKAITRVIIESTDENKNNWSTVGVSSNVINASYIALKDSITYKLIKAKTKSALR